MLGIFFLYWVGKYFYKLAEQHHKRKWAYAILGAFAPDLFLSVNDTLLGALLIPFGFLSCYLFYQYLKYSWNTVSSLKTNAQQTGTINNDSMDST